MPKTFVYTGQGYELTPGGLPNPQDPIHYYEKKSGKRVDVKLNKIRCQLVSLWDSGWAVIKSNRSGAEYGVKLGKLK